MIRPDDLIYRSDGYVITANDLEFSDDGAICIRADSACAQLAQQIHAGAPYQLILTFHVRKRSPTSSANRDSETLAQGNVTGPSDHGDEPPPSDSVCAGWG